MNIPQLTYWYSTGHRALRRAEGFLDSSGGAAPARRRLELRVREQPARRARYSARVCRARNTLLARCPALTTLWLDGEDFLFHWRGSLNGVEKEFVTADESECPLFKRTITPSHDA
jgi:hypothetical protein